MKRKLSNEIVGEIKRMIVKGYKNSTIKDLVKDKFNIDISNGDLQTIKKGSGYSDIEDHLNEKIMKMYQPNNNIDKDRVHDIKWALVNGFSENDIKINYDVSKSILREIKYNRLPYYNIASEYNSELEKIYPKRKTTNIDENDVINIKKLYVQKRGDILLKDIAETYKTHRGTISKILNFNYYKETGEEFNEKIKKIKDNKSNAKNKKKVYQLKSMNTKERQKIEKLRQKRAELMTEIKKSQLQIDLNKKEIRKIG